MITRTPGKKRLKQFELGTSLPCLSIESLVKLVYIIKIKQLSLPSVILNNYEDLKMRTY